MLERHRIVEIERERPLILITTHAVKCVSLEGEIVSTMVVAGGGTNHQSDRSQPPNMMLEYY